MNSGARRILAACAASVLLAGFAPRARAALSSLDSLVAAERAFSAMSVEHGMKQASLTWLADDAVLFDPAPMIGREALEGREDSGAVVRWAPATGEVSAAGDLGWITGPWEYRPAPDSGQPTAHGHFVSIWRRQKDGLFRVAVDLGISHRALAGGGVDATRFRPGAPIDRQSPHASHWVHPASFDHSLGERTRRTSISEAFSSVAAEDVRLNLEGLPPREGRLESVGALDSLGGAWHFVLAGVGVAQSNDLAFTYGHVERWYHGARAAIDTCGYLHVWRRDVGNRWELLVAVHQPVTH